MKQSQRGSALIVVGGILALVAVGLIALVTMYISAANYGNKAEVDIKKIWENNQNLLGQYTLKVQEIASVPAMYKDDLKEVMTSVMVARQGPEGSKATFQFFKEHNIAIDSVMYTKIQQVIEAGRNEFTKEQTHLIDYKGTYQTALGAIPQGFFLHMAGYPKIDLDKYKPVVAGDTREVFEKGVQAPIKLR